MNMKHIKIIKKSINDYINDLNIPDLKIGTRVLNNNNKNCCSFTIIINTKFNFINKEILAKEIVSAVNDSLKVYQHDFSLRLNQVTEDQFILEYIF